MKGKRTGEKDTVGKSWRNHRLFPTQQKHYWSSLPHTVIAPADGASKVDIESKDLPKKPRFCHRPEKQQCS